MAFGTRKLHDPIYLLEANSSDSMVSVGGSPIEACASFQKLDNNQENVILERYCEVEFL